MEYATLNNGIKMPMAGIGTFLLTPDEAEASVLSALSCGYRLIDTANAYASTDALQNACVDPRFKYVTRGSAEYKAVRIGSSLACIRMKASVQHPPVTEKDSTKWWRMRWLGKST